VDVSPVAGHIGAEISGIDLAAPLDKEAVTEIRSALLRWKVVFFRGQNLDHGAYVAFARHFGELLTSPSRGPGSPAAFPEVESTVDWARPELTYGMDAAEWADRNRHTVFRGWHRDLSPWIDPPAATMLRAEAVPSYGGDTTWSNLAAAYAGLSEPVRRFADTLRAEHRYGVGYQSRPDRDGYLDHLRDHQVASVHPVVRVHPETGERVLFIDQQYVERIVGVSRPESRRILEMLAEQTVRPEYTVRFRWEPGSIAFWDNRATMHLAPGDLASPDQPRILHRILVAGDIPVGVDGRPSEPLVGTRLHRPTD
jgi:taurine dioxygenase